MSSIIRRIARRIAGSEAPQQGGFPGASNSFPTWITAIDERCEPPRRLIELMLSATRIAMDDIDLSDIAARPGVPDWFNVWPGEHYRLLAAFVKLIQPRVVIEIGTDTGLSSLAMRKYLPQGGRLVTYDLRPWRMVPEHDLVEEDFADGQLEQRLEDLAESAAFERNRLLIQQAEFFFIDGPKNLVFERAFIKHLSTIDFAKPPILLFDDTRLPCMVQYWRDLKYPKLDITGFAHWSGSGLVELAR